MGIVYKPEDVARKKVEKGLRDIGVKPAIPTESPSLELLASEIRELRVEIERIKKALVAHGIPV